MNVDHVRTGKPCISIAMLAYVRGPMMSLRAFHLLFLLKNPNLKTQRDLPEPRLLASNELIYG
jgi:hypothetical protein